jgi:hypothetical protein
MRWTAVTEQKPPTTEWLLVWAGGRPAVAAYTRKFGYLDFFGAHSRIDGVTHWILIEGPDEQPDAHDIERRRRERRAIDEEA